jgi:hypothetical protein
MPPPPSIPHMYWLTHTCSLLDKLLSGRLEYLEPLKNVFIRQLCSVEQIVTSVNKMALFWEETAE